MTNDTHSCLNTHAPFYLNNQYRKVCNSQKNLLYFTFLHFSVLIYLLSIWITILSATYWPKPQSYCAWKSIWLCDSTAARFKVSLLSLIIHRLKRIWQMHMTKSRYELLKETGSLCPACSWGGGQLYRGVRVWFIVCSYSEVCRSLCSARLSSSTAHSKFIHS